MIKTYRIIPLVFILFLFGFTFSTVSPVIAQTVDQLIESIEKLDANDRARVLEYKYSPPHRPSDATPAAEADGPWDISMGMRHPARPCMKANSCGPDTRSPEEIASDPYDTPHVKRLKEESSAARRNACARSGSDGIVGVCMPSCGTMGQKECMMQWTPDFVKQSTIECHQCETRRQSGFGVIKGKALVFDRLIACQQKTQTPCN